jgi:IMP dehydrogenase/GMP reductase
MGLIKNKIYYTYEDVTIIPNVVSLVEHRSECIPLDEEGMLPLFTAPMDTVVNSKNFGMFENEMIHAILPRTESLDARIENSIRGRWSAYSLSEFEKVFCNELEKLDEKNKIKALIDIANGHMSKSIDLVRAAKNIYGDNIIIMVGNIANPKTYAEYARVGADYIRIGIGSGCGCLSSSNTGIHMPMATLIDETVEIKKSLEDEYKKLPKIIADGGIRNYRDIIKALALGADYVMIGSVFAKMLESAAPKSAYSDEWLKLPIEIELEDLTDFTFDNVGWRAKYNGKEIFLGDIRATFYGMASREGQIALNGAKTKTSEGIKKTLPVLYTMHGWSTNFMDYLRSAMSYLGVKDLNGFRDYANVIINSQNAVSAVNK